MEVEVVSLNGGLLASSNFSDFEATASESHHLVVVLAVASLENNKDFVILFRFFLTNENALGLLEVTDIVRGDNYTSDIVSCQWITSESVRVEGRDESC